MSEIRITVDTHPQRGFTHWKGLRVNVRGSTGREVRSILEDAQSLAEKLSATVVTEINGIHYVIHSDDDVETLDALRRKADDMLRRSSEDAQVLAELRKRCPATHLLDFIDMLHAAARNVEKSDNPEDLLDGIRQYIVLDDQVISR